MQPLAPLTAQVMFRVEAAGFYFFPNADFSIKGLIIKHLLIPLSTYSANVLGASNSSPL